MGEKVVCAYCGEEVVGEGVRRGRRIYCSEACAFEDSRSLDCAGRTDIGRASLEEEFKFRENPPIS